MMFWMVDTPAGDISRCFCVGKIGGGSAKAAKSDPDQPMPAAARLH
jgi:hypothetical protein